MTAGATPKRAPAGVDLDSLAQWLVDTRLGFTPPLHASLLEGGRSNITVRLTDAEGRDFVLRRPPLHGVLPTAHDMGREHRIIAALGPTPVPVPDALVLCTDTDVIGAPFYLMSYVPGIVLNDATTAVTELDESARHHSAESLIDALVALHAVDPDDVGLGDLARRDGLVERQLKRWHAQFEASHIHEVPAVDRVHKILASRVPEQRESRIVHGDFRLGNCIVDDDGSVQAVLDWEICTLGDPLADVGYVLAGWAEPGDEIRTTEDSLTAAPGFPPRSEILARYTAQSGRDVSNIDYFVAFSLWKLACIMEGVNARAKQGARGDTEDLGDVYQRQVENCAQLAEERAAGL